MTQREEVSQVEHVQQNVTDASARASGDGEEGEMIYSVLNVFFIYKHNKFRHVILTSHFFS